jgi:hypothetical protein
LRPASDRRRRRKNWPSRCSHRSKGEGPLIAIPEFAAAGLVVAPGAVFSFHCCSGKLLRDLLCLAEARVEAGVKQKQITGQLDGPEASHFLPRFHLTRF